MDYAKIIFVTLSVIIFLGSTVRAQDIDVSKPQDVFTNITKHQGWGPFTPRESYEPQHFTSTFTVDNQEYKVFQLIDPDINHKKQRFIFQKVNSEVTFSEHEGAPIYYRQGDIQLEDKQYDIVGYSEEADQFVLLEQEKVEYEQSGLPLNTSAPPIERTSIFGKPISLAKLQDRYVLLNFWGTWCGPCLAEMPYFKEAYRKFGDEVAFIGIAVDDNKERLTRYLEAKNIKWPQIYIPWDSKNNAPLLQKYHVLGYPSTFLISPEGNILLGPEQRSRLRDEAIVETLEAVLSKDKK